jgi:hypothetical protein
MPETMADCVAERLGAARNVATARRYVAVFIAPPGAWVTTACAYRTREALGRLLRQRDADENVTMTTPDVSHWYLRKGALQQGAAGVVLSAGKLALDRVVFGI